MRLANIELVYGLCAFGAWPLLHMEKIVFTVKCNHESGWFVARWDNPGKGGIATQGKGLHELEEMIQDAVSSYFAGEKIPHSVQLHFIEDPELVLV